MKEIKQVTVYLYPAEHKQLKRVAVEKETTVSEIIRSIIAIYLHREEKATI